MALASRSKRCRLSGDEASRAGSTLTATSRPSRVSRARYTSPMPPAPSGWRISYGPRREPGERVIRKRAVRLSCRRLGRRHDDLAQAQLPPLALEGCEALADELLPLVRVAVQLLDLGGEHVA